MKSWLSGKKVLICAGTGGVGKTTLSASLGVLAAEAGLRTLVLTIDPARRLAQALGLEGTHSAEAIAVPGQENLWASMIDPQREFDEFVLGSVDTTLAKGLFDNRLYHQLVTNLNGSQEFTSLVRLLRAAESNKYDLVILDTPPTQNAVDFLQAPARIYALFQDSVIGWFADSPSSRQGFIKRALSRGTRLVTSALENVTGSTFIHELKDFFNHISHLKSQVAEVSRETERLLRLPSTEFFLVTGFDETKLAEAIDFRHDLESGGFRLAGVLVNRWVPEWQEPKVDPRLLDFYRQFSLLFEQRQKALAQFVTQLGGQIPLLKLPDYQDTVLGLDDLRRVAHTLDEKWRSAKHES